MRLGVCLCDFELFSVFQWPSASCFAFVSLVSFIRGRSGHPLRPVPAGAGSVPRVPHAAVARPPVRTLSPFTLPRGARPPPPGRPSFSVSKRGSCSVCSRALFFRFLASVRPCGVFDISLSVTPSGSSTLSPVGRAGSCSGVRGAALHPRVHRRTRGRHPRRGRWEPRRCDPGGVSLHAAFWLYVSVHALRARPRRPPGRDRTRGARGTLASGTGDRGIWLKALLCHLTGFRG